MKRLFYLLALVLILVLAGCSAPDSSDTSTDSAADSSSETTETQVDDADQTALISSPETAFDLGVFTADHGGDYYYFDTTADELISAINKRVTEAGYQAYSLASSRIGEEDHKRDAYSYTSPESAYTLTVRVLHGNQKIYTVALSLSLLDENIAREQFMMESLADYFAPGMGKEVGQNLEIYSLTKEDEESTRTYPVGNTVFSVNVPYSFNITSSEY